MMHGLSMAQFMSIVGGDCRTDVAGVIKSSLTCAKIDTVEPLD